MAFSEHDRHCVFFQPLAEHSWAPASLRIQMAIGSKLTAPNKDGFVVRKASVRAIPGGYFSALVVSSFVAALIAYLGYTEQAIPVVVISWIAIPVLWLTDKITFDGKRLVRTGLFPKAWARATATRDRVKVSDIEQIETSVFRGVKRGRNVYYTYRTTITGKTARFVLSSSHRGYREMIRSLLPLVAEDILDNASIDLRDYIAERGDLGKRAKDSDIPSSDVLDGSFRDIHLGASKLAGFDHVDADSLSKANNLRRLANELRLSGRLFQALEAFRRAAILRPKDARLLFEFAACIRSVAGAERDEKLEHKARAMLRLAERYAADDSDLLARIGESYFQFGDWRRAAIVFKRGIDVFGESFRILRGMAELSLREGKLAHVIHNFAAANEVAKTHALKRWTRTEVEYFSHLNADEEYMELEISRVNLLDTLDRTKRSSVRVALLGSLAIVLGIALGDNLIANIGWAISGVSLTLWIVTILMGKMLSPRIPFELMASDD